MAGTESLPDELRRRANEAYHATGINLSVLHGVAYRMEVQEQQIDQLKEALARKDAALKAMADAAVKAQDNTNLAFL